MFNKIKDKFKKEKERFVLDPQAGIEFQKDFQELIKKYEAKGIFVQIGTTPPQVSINIYKDTEFKPGKKKEEEGN
jgi:hypothetical protein